jgi:para-nitrobenzyl esterase
MADTRTGLGSISRRSALKTLGLAAGAGTVSAFTPAAQAAALGEYPPLAPAAGDTISASNDSPLVETVSGKVRGYERSGIYVFKGIPYAGTTGGANRFLPPKKATPWAGIRSSMQFGPVCPQPARTGWHDDEVAWLFSWNDGFPGEDCLRVNLWTPGINDGRKRPVMVWLHGGGYTAGSGQELPSYDGENLSRRGDVVVVTLNHRLNVFGFLNLAGYGSQFQDSGNAGMLDIVAALEWVRDNIAQFGGDPNLVTIFGQSGGGGKVTALMAMPSAKGLFHRAIVESGSLMTGQTEEASRKLADELVAKLGLNKSSIDKLQQMPADQLEDAAVAVTKRPQGTPGVIDFRHIGSLLGWAPVVDGNVLPRQPFAPDAPAQSAHIPLLVGTTLNEFVSGMGRPDAFKMTDDELKKMTQQVFHDQADNVIAAARQVYPNAIPFQLWSVIAVSGVRGSALTQAQRKAAQGAAPAYCYQFTWQTPVLSGRPMAFHCSEISFVFDNTDRCENMTGGGPAARALAAKVSDAWIAFARTGDPNHPGLPRWTPLTAETNATMVFDDECALKNQLDQPLQDATNRA